MKAPRTTPLTQADVKAWNEAHKEFGKREEQLHERIDDIFDVICEAFDKKRTGWWYFDGAMEGEVGNINIYSLNNWDGFISVITEEMPSLHVLNVDYTCGFPTKFLYMPRAEIIKHIHEQMDEEKAKKAAAKKRKEKKLSKKEALKKAAFEKLTPEERKAVGLKK